MADQCDEPLPDRVRHAIAEFNAGQYFEQHETLEAAWRAELRPIREMYRGILQIGLACYQVQHANGVGAIKMLDRAQRLLQPFRPACQGVEVDRLLADAEKLRHEIEREGFDHLDRIDRSLFPIVHLRTSDH
jgi:predicted metal-dependent hydrolase